MNRILCKKSLTSTVKQIWVEAPLIAAKAEPGQFVILRANANSERIPLTIADCQSDKGCISVIYQVVGAGTMQLDQLEEDDCLSDIAGPLGKPTEFASWSKVLVVGGGVGTAVALPVAKKLSSMGVELTSIIGFRSSDQAILNSDFATLSTNFHICTDDGSLGYHGYVSTLLEQLLAAGEIYDAVFAIGPLPMMAAIVSITKQHDLPTTVSLNPIMIDGTGMCGCCRVTINGKTKFACVDGPDFDGFTVDFAEAIRRNQTYLAEEYQAREAECNLLKGGTDR